MKPMIKYRGGKSKEIPHIMWHIPRFSGRYIEPFVGGGALYFYLEPREAIINDINKQLINFYKGVRDYFPKLRKELDEIEALYEINRRDYEALKSNMPDEKVEDKNEVLYYFLRDMFNNKVSKEYSDALLYYFINKTAYSGMIRYNADGDFNVPYGRYKHLLLSAKLQNDTISLSATPINRRCGFFFRKVSPLSQRVKVRRVDYRGYPRPSTNLFRDARRNCSSQCST